MNDPFLTELYFDWIFFGPDLNVLTRTLAIFRQEAKAFLIYVNFLLPSSHKIHSAESLANYQQ